MIQTSSLALVFLAWYIGWRIWSFTVSPRLHKTRPRELPYWIPYFGHAWTFFSDYNGLYDQGREYFNNSLEPYIVTILGEKIVVITSPEDTSALYKYESVFTFDSIINDWYRILGSSKESFAKIFSVNPELNARFGQKGGQAKTHDLVLALHRQELTVGEAADRLFTEKLHPSIVMSLSDLQKDDLQAPLASRTANVEVVTSLWNLCSRALVSGMVEAYMGKALWKVNPHFERDFGAWERTNWKLLYAIPRFLSNDLQVAKDKLLDTYTNYFKLPAQERDDCAPFVTFVEALLRAAELPLEDISRVLHLQLWAAAGNAYKVAFWMLYYLLRDRNLLERVVQETRKTSASSNENALIEDCPLMDSVYTETLRMVVAGALLKEGLEPVAISGRIIPVGKKILVPFIQLHRNQNAWGPTPDDFKADRFAENPKLFRSKSMRAFGGGSHLCPGRNLSKRATLTFIGLMLREYDISAEIPSGGLQPDFGKPGVGTPGVIGGKDLELRMMPRTVVNVATK